MLWLHTGPCVLNHSSTKIQKDLGKTQVKECTYIFNT